MALSFQKRLRAGPSNVTLSAAGIRLSAGIHGARVSLGPRGTYISFSAGGFRYRRKLDDAPAAEPAQPEDRADGTLAKRSAEALHYISPDEIAREIEARAKRIDWFKPYWIGALIVVFIVLVSSGGWAALILATILAGAG